MENMENTNPMDSQETPTPETGSKMTSPDGRSTGSIVGIIIIVIILALGGFYFWGQKLDTNGDEAVTEDTEIVNETADLEADLAEVDTVTADLEADLNAVEEELAQ